MQSYFLPLPLPPPHSLPPPFYSTHGFNLFRPLLEWDSLKINKEKNCIYLWEYEWKREYLNLWNSEIKNRYKKNWILKYLGSVKQ